MPNLPHNFDNGLTAAQDAEISALKDHISNELIPRIIALGAHRSYSLAITKLEEASHWLWDRRIKTKGER